MRTLLLVLGSMFSFGVPTLAWASECDSPAAAWLMCEDFETAGGDFPAWYAASDFVQCNGCSDGVNNPDRITLSGDDPHDGEFALLMPAAASAGYRGASLAYRTCDGEQRASCPLVGQEQLYYRAWVKLAPDHAYVHHFMSIAGTRPDAFWESDGNAGCRPNGVRSAGTTVDFNGDHELFFYTYYPEMHCDAGGYCSGDYAANICSGCATKDMACDDGPECCWGNHFSADPRPVLPRDEWVCLEMMMRLNTVGQSDGEMAFWINDTLGHRQTGMHWRDVEELQLNKVWVQHYIDSGDADQSNRIQWDDVVVSTERIGCGGLPVEPGEDVGSPPTDAGQDPPDAGTDLGDTEHDLATGLDTGPTTPTDAPGSPGEPAAEGGAVHGTCGCDTTRPHRGPRALISAALLLTLAGLWHRTLRV